VDFPDYIAVPIFNANCSGKFGQALGAIGNGPVQAFKSNTLNPFSNIGAADCPNTDPIVLLCFHGCIIFLKMEWGYTAALGVIVLYFMSKILGYLERTAIAAEKTAGIKSPPPMFNPYTGHHHHHSANCRCPASEKK
jgi:hypothetical protein